MYAPIDRLGEGIMFSGCPSVRVRTDMQVVLYNSII